MVKLMYIIRSLQMSICATIAVLALIIGCKVRAQETGFYSIDCGSTANSSYTDEITGIIWTPDSSIMNLGRSVPVSGNGPSRDSGQRYGSLRFFPETNYTKFCYDLSPVTAGGLYIVRAGFWIGDRSDLYDSSLTQVSFKFIINSYEVTNVTVSLQQESTLWKEVYVMANTSNMYACLASGIDAPFITSIELRPLPSTTYAYWAVEKERFPLIKVARSRFVSTTSSTPLRYPDDKVDRIWGSLQTSNLLSTTSPITPDAPTEPTPEKVFQSSWAPTLDGGPAILYTPVDVGEHWYLLTLFFAEINATVNKAGLRVFDVGVNTTTSYITLMSSFDIYASAGSTFKEYTMLNLTQVSGGWFNITLSRHPNSTLTPIIAGTEVLQYLDFTIPLGTNPTDVLAISLLKNNFHNILSDHVGDPCLPRQFKYPWLNCTYGTQTRVIRIELPNAGLLGQIPSSFNNLSMLSAIYMNGNSLEGSIPYLGSLVNLQELDLSNNKLTGPIPDFLSTLPYLRILYLQNNNLSGPIPTSLFKDGLDFRYNGNPNICGSNTTCDSFPSPSPSNASSKKLIGIILGSILGAILIIMVITLGYCSLKKHHWHSKETMSDVYTIDAKEILHKALILSFNDISEATRGFVQVLGGGGFGAVYEGTLKDGRGVAIKVLSNDTSQVQGLNEFMNEASLLSTIHHKNIVQLIGFCIEQKVAIVYELMPYGSLYNALFGGKLFLTWVQRLKIMVDVAKGLEYLHNQCIKQIIHRDVKSSNILLDNNLCGKVADLGISKDNNQTTRLMGSLGYLDPEYLQTSKLTTMVDIYSFGVVLFEVITGKPALFKSNYERHIGLVNWVKPLVESANLEELVDSKLTYNENAMWNVIDIASLCTKPSSLDRPKHMGEVASSIMEALELEQNSTNMN